MHLRNNTAQGFQVLARASVRNPSMNAGTNEDVSCGHEQGPSVSRSNTLDRLLLDIPSKKRRVRFRQKPIIINSDTVEGILTAEDVTTRWWIQDSLDNIKQEARELSAVVRRKNREVGCAVRTAFRKVTFMLSGNIEELVKMSASMPEEDLQEWCRAQDGRRGLEKLACKEYALSRRQDVSDLRTVVLLEQARQASLKVNNDDLLANLSREISRRSKTFALMVAAADASESRDLNPTESTRLSVLEKKLAVAEARAKKEKKSTGNRSTEAKEDDTEGGATRKEGGSADGNTGVAKSDGNEASAARKEVLATGRSTKDDHTLVSEATSTRQAIVGKKTKASTREGSLEESVKIKRKIDFRGEVAIEESGRYLNSERVRKAAKESDMRSVGNTVPEFSPRHRERLHVTSAV